MLSLAGLAEPIRIIAKSEAVSLTAAISLFETLYNDEKRCSLRIVSHYTQSECEALLHEEYPSFIIVGCDEKRYHEKMPSAIFLNVTEAYAAARAFSEYALSFAFAVAAGFIGKGLESCSTLNVPDEILKDALQHGEIFLPDRPIIEEVNEAAFSRIMVGGFAISLRDFGEIINACARMSKATLLTAALSGDTASQQAVMRAWSDYKRNIATAVDWCKHNTNSFIKGEGYQIIHMHDYILPSLVGGAAAQLVQNIPEKTLVLVLAYQPDNLVKASLRMHGTYSDVILVEVFSNIMEGIHGDYGGDATTAGGVFARPDEEKFVEQAQRVLRQAFAEERV